MAEGPPQRLVDSLTALRLAAASDFRAVRWRMRRLARGLPWFESVWVDALAQARILTPYQAAQINAGRESHLRVGPYCLLRPLAASPIAATFLAREIGSGERVRLAAFPAGDDPAALREAVEAVAKHSSSLAEVETLGPITAVGEEGERLWAASRHVEGVASGEWMVHHGRFPPEVVLEIARQMLEGLVPLEEAGLTHGDLGAMSLVLSWDGRVFLPHPGLRGVLRPQEGYGHAALPPAAYDGFPPERIAGGGPPQPAGDRFAFGCLLWHLLAGRPPLPGASATAKLLAAEKHRIGDIRQIAPDTPPPLAAAVEACLQRSPRRRPESMARIAEGLGAPTRRGRLALVRCLVHGRPRTVRILAPLSSATRGRRAPLLLAAAAGGGLTAALLGWWLWLGFAGGPPTAPRVRGESEVAALESTSQTSRPEPDPVGVDQGEDRPARAGPAAFRQAREFLETSAAATSPANRGAPAEPPTFLVDATEPIRAESLALSAGMHVAPEAERATVLVPREGLLVAVEDVRFENIDFRPQAPSLERAGGGLGGEPGALVRVAASRCTFVGCTFLGTDDADGSARRERPFAPVGVRWEYPPDPADSPPALPSGRIVFADCLIRDVSAGVESRTAAAILLDFRNVAFLRSGPLLELDRPPRQDEPVFVRLARTTLRGSGALLACRSAETALPTAQIAIQTDASVLLTEESTSLLLFEGTRAPAELLRSVQWSGQGSLVGPQTLVAGLQAGGEVVPLDDSELAIAGLVRSRVEFAGPIEGTAADQELVRWQAPLHSTDPPGVDPARLPNP